MNIDDYGPIIGTDTGGRSVDDRPWVRPLMFERLMISRHTKDIGLAFRWTYTAEGYDYWLNIFRSHRLLTNAELEQARLAYARVLLLAG